MALVADAVNHFFSPPHMSETSSRAASSRSPNTEHYGQTREKDQDGHASEISAEATASPRLPGRDELPSENPNDAQPIARRSSDSGDSSQPSTNVTDDSGWSTPQKIKVRDLAHIQTLAQKEQEDGQTTTPVEAPTQYEISGMPIENIIEMVAGLLTKITSTNDVQHEHLHRQVPPPDSTTAISPQTSSVLAFHGKNVPSITILSYLNRINKYCPTSYEVFISLLVYFDRMTEMVNARPIQSLRDQRAASNQPQTVCEESSVPMEGVRATGPAQIVTPPPSGDLDKPQQCGAIPGTPHSRSFHPESPPLHSRPGSEQNLNLSHFFVVDSFNIHRLVIAGVTCASKFFSDIFYTNSRYAKVSRLSFP